MPWLVRAAYDRNTDEGAKLFAQAASAPKLGEVKWNLPGRPGRRAREVIQEVRAGKVKLKAPKRLGRAAGSVEVHMVYAHEIDPPKGETPVTWLLLTNLPVTNLAEALEKIEWYRCRWQVEVYFKTLKSGCGVEKLQLQSRHGLENAIAALMLVAWRIQYLSTIARDRAIASQSCEKWLEQVEWQCLYMLHKRSQIPEKAPSIGEAVRMLGALGGHLGRKGDGHPGAQAIGRGLLKLYLCIESFAIFQQLHQDV